MPGREVARAVDGLPWSSSSVEGLICDARALSMILPIRGARKLSIPWGAERRRATRWSRL